MKERISKFGMSMVLILLLGNTILTAKETTLDNLMEVFKHTTWSNITVPTTETTLEDLASTYYGDQGEALLIYNANRDIISENKVLRIGMILKLPITEKFIEQPEYLGWR